MVSGVTPTDERYSILFLNIPVDEIPKGTIVSSIHKASV